MGLNKPYFRQFRKNLKGGSEEYVHDTRYSADRVSAIHSFYLIEKDIKILFDYLSPDNRNSKAFSHRIYELFFRACTEFESNAKGILKDNGYVNPAKTMDYWN